MWDKKYGFLGSIQQSPLLETGLQGLLVCSAGVTHGILNLKITFKAQSLFRGRQAGWSPWVPTSRGVPDYCTFLGGCFFCFPDWLAMKGRRGIVFGSDTPGIGVCIKNVFHPGRQKAKGLGWPCQHPNLQMHMLAHMARSSARVYQHSPIYSEGQIPSWHESG